MWPPERGAAPGRRPAGDWLLRTAGGSGDRRSHPEYTCAPRGLRGRRLARAHEGAHELPVHLGRNGVGVEARPLEELAGVLQAIDARGLDLDGLETHLGELGAVLLVLERARHAADPQLHAPADRKSVV